MKTGTIHKVLSLLLTAAIVLNMGLAPAFAEGADTYTVEVVAWQGGDDSTLTYSISNAAPVAGELVTVIVTTTRSGYGTAGVDFYDRQNRKVITIPGYEIKRSYDNPNQFTFIMPPQNVDLQVRADKTITVATKPYYDPAEGKATPASADGSIQAIPFVVNDCPLAQMFSAWDNENFDNIPPEGFVSKFEDNADYGTIDCSGERLTYRPNAAAAGKTVKILLKGYIRGSVATTAHTFSVAVDNVPNPALSRDATLKMLSYSIDGAQSIPIVLQDGVFAYEVTLPADTSVNKSIVLSGEPSHARATISGKIDSVTSYHKQPASLTVAAEDSTAQQTYVVNFAMQVPDTPRAVTIDGTNYVDGATIALKSNQEHTLGLSLGSGTSGAGSCEYSSSNFETLSLAGAFYGVYPNVYDSNRFTPAKPCKETITVKFYQEATTNHNGLTPIETITLNIEVNYMDISAGNLILTDVCADTCAGHLVTGSTDTYKILVQSGTHDVTLKNASIQLSEDKEAAFSVEGGSTVNLTLEGVNTLKSGDGRAGLEVTLGNTLTINGENSDSLSATAGSDSAGIGGGLNGDGGNITIRGGIVTATGGRYGAGIGGGDQGDSGTITIEQNAVVFAVKGSGGVPIGPGAGGVMGAIKRNNGIIFEDNVGKVYGNVLLPVNLEVTSTQSLEVSSGNSLTIPSDIVLTNNGELMGSGALINNGTMLGSGTYVGSGSYTGIGKVALVKSMIRPPANLSYNGEPKAVAVKLLGYTFAEGTDYTVEYNPNTDLINPGGEITPTVTPRGDKLTGSAVEGDPFTIRKAAGGSGGGSGGGGSNTTVTVSEKDIEAAIKTAQEEAEKNGTEKNGIPVTITLDTKKTINSFAVNLPKSVQEKLIVAGVSSLTINGGGAITFDLEAIKQIKATANADVTVTATKIANSALSKEAQTATGGRPVYDFKVTGDGKDITTFGNGKLSLSVPYELQKVDGNGNLSVTGVFETPGNLVGVYIDGAGNLTYLPGSSYDVTNKAMLINTNHLSFYGVAYKTNVPQFTDTANHWAKADIEFVTARGLFSGTSTTTFSPDTAMTRAMFVTALGKLEGIDSNDYKTSSFTDVTAGSYYLGYVEWAVKNNIVKGVGNGKFAPDRPISRQEMVVMLQSHTKAIEYKLPTVHKEIVFTDDASISTWAKSAVKEMQMAGIITGKEGGVFDPTGTATRAEVAAMLRKFVELEANSGN